MPAGALPRDPARRPNTHLTPAPDFKRRLRMRQQVHTWRAQAPAPPAPPLPKSHLNHLLPHPHVGGRPQPSAMGKRHPPHSLLCPHADGRQLVGPHPHACQPRDARALQARHLCQRADGHLLQAAFGRQACKGAQRPAAVWEAGCKGAPRPAAALVQQAITMEELRGMHGVASVFVVGTTGSVLCEGRAAAARRHPGAHPGTRVQGVEGRASCVNARGWAIMGGAGQAGGACTHLLM